jgi:hypothetical protein
MPSQATDGVAIAPRGRDQLLVSLAVPAGGTGCGTPTFMGFDTAGNTTLAKIARSPWDASCAYISSTTYDVALDMAAIPAASTEIAIADEWCHTPDSICNAVAIPR